MASRRAPTSSGDRSRDFRTPETFDRWLRALPSVISWAGFVTSAFFVRSFGVAGVILAAFLCSSSMAALLSAHSSPFGPDLTLCSILMSSSLTVPFAYRFRALRTARLALDALTDEPLMVLRKLYRLETLVILISFQIGSILCQVIYLKLWSVHGRCRALSRGFDTNFRLFAETNKIQVTSFFHT